ncbi:cytochrome P450 2D10-like [Biomphalaria glabrata]|uniref:Cytochrome P450 2D10-like n=1 Tax=Biomphalaria glabrata TaxID=6526 RepID=A0A9U8E5I2_BIOGL|nr:cytochrome P450 2D10-like [Biomphalaria glabrata]
MDERNLKMIFFDLFAAGSETTFTTIYWFVLYMLHHPDVQKKIFDEINEHVGTERVPNMQDKQSLTYLNAAIMETQRLASIAPNFLPRTCHSDMQVRGYTIPKDTFILPCLDSVLHDSQIWGHDVMAFNPERFISQDGKLQIPKEFIPFSVGNRTCLWREYGQNEFVSLQIKHDSKV